MAKRMVTMRLDERIDNNITLMAREQNTSKAAIVEEAIHMLSTREGGTDRVYYLAYHAVVSALKVLTQELFKIEQHMPENDQLAEHLNKVLQEFSDNSSSRKRWGRPDLERRYEIELAEDGSSAKFTETFNDPVHGIVTRQIPEIPAEKRSEANIKIVSPSRKRARKPDNKTETSQAKDVFLSSTPSPDEQ